MSGAATVATATAAIPDPGGFAQFLSSGGLGVLALISLIVLGYNTWSLHRLVQEMPADKIKETVPLLKFQMIVCGLGLTLAGAGAVYLAIQDADRDLTLVVQPSPGSIDTRYYPMVRISGRSIADPRGTIAAICEKRRPTMIDVDFTPYIEHRIQLGEQARQVLAAPAL